MTSTNPDLNGFATEEIPDIQIQYFADPQHAFGDFTPHSPYDAGVGLGQSDFLFAYRSGAASDSGSDVSCHSSPSSSPYIGPYSPAPQFTGVNPDHERLSLDHSGNDAGSGIYTSYHPSTHSLNEMSLPNSAPPDSPYYPQMTHQSRNFHRSMPELLTIPSEYSPAYFDGMNAQPQGALCRSPSTSSVSSYIPDLHTPNEMHDVNNNRLSMEFSHESMTRNGHRRSTSGSSISMNSIRELIDKDFSDGTSLDVRQVHDSLVQTAHPRLFLKPPKNTVATAAGQLASDKRRKHPGKFRCNIEGCSASFTRKLGLENHFKSHLGIADQECDFCHRLFSNSLGRHMKRCKQNPSREPSSSKKSSTATVPL